MALRQARPFPGRVWEKLAAGNHTQSSLYGKKAGRALAVSASGKPRLGLTPRAQQAFVLTLAHPHLGWRPCWAHSSQDPSPFELILLRLGTKRHHQGRRPGHPAVGTTHVPHPDLIEDLLYADRGITVEPAPEEDDRCDGR